ncbi:MAG: sulfatase-like hydrolase/transferase [Planctomycetota bacterium]
MNCRIALALITCFASCVSLLAEKRPNVIVVMPDDMGYGDLGFTGNPVVRTPNLDRFAKQSSNLTDFYVSPVCSPTRACLMTGRYNYRTRVIDTFKGRSMMDPDEVTVAELLRDAGYATGIFGKWHLGDNYPMRAHDQGFDMALVHRGGGLAQPSEPIENRQRYTDPILYRNGVAVQASGYCTDVYFDAAMEFMQESNREGKPFFVYLPPNAPHGPFHDVPEDLLDYYESIDLDPVLGKNKSDKHRDTVARVFAMVENIDQNFGRLEKVLKANRLYENTLVMFLTDNGPNSNRYVGPFREMKGRVHEGGIRTVFFARWPKGIKQIATDDRIAAHIDLMPTILAASDVDVPHDLKLDGRNLLPLLDGSIDSDWSDRTLVLQTHRGDRPQSLHHVAVRNQRWKLVHPSGFGNEQMPKDVPFEMYEIGEDASERNNLFSSLNREADELVGRYKTWFEDVSNSRADNYAPPRIIIGTKHESRTDLSIQDWRVGESAGWGQNGKWKVSITHSGPYDAMLQWAEPSGRRDVVLEVGKWSYRGVLEDGEAELVFNDIQLPVGDRDIGFMVSPANTSRDQTIRFVTLEQDFETQQDGGMKDSVFTGDQHLVNPSVFSVNGHQAFVMTPQTKPAGSPKPWVFYAPTLPRYPDKAEAWMHQRLLDAGIAIAGVDVGEAYGSPDSIKTFEGLHSAMVERGYSSKPVVLGRSRGGLWAARLAIEHPEWVAGIGGIYPVFDCLSYPGVKKAADAYGVEQDLLQASESSLNPLTRLHEIANAKIPIYIIHGDDDKVVPLEENSVKLLSAYTTKGIDSLVTLNIAKGQGHSFWEGFFHCEPLLDFLIDQATNAAKSEVNP